MTVFARVELLPPAPRTGWRLAAAALMSLLAFGLLADAGRRYLAHQAALEAARSRSAQYRQAEQQRADQRQALAERLGQLDRLAEPWLPVVSFPWDELMLSAERLKLPGVRLTSLSVDAQQGAGRLVLECGSASQAAEVSRWLNEGYPPGQRKWRLLRTRALPGGAALVEAEFQFSAKGGA